MIHKVVNQNFAQTGESTHNNFMGNRKVQERAYKARDAQYDLSDEQKKAVEEAQHQFKNGQFLKSEPADKEIEEWLGEEHVLSPPPDGLKSYFC